MGATYYISTTGNDTNSGTIGSPWKTLAKASTTLNAGDTVYIRGGTYADRGVTWLPTIGTAISPVSVLAYPGETPVYNGSHCAVAFLVVGTSGPSKYTTFNGLTVKNYGRQGEAASGSGMWFGYDLTIGDWNQGCKVQSCIFQNIGSAINLDHGIYLSYGVKDFECSNNTFISIAGACLQCWHAPGPERVDMWNNQCFGAHWGLVSGDSSSAITVTNNLFVDMTVGIDLHLAGETDLNGTHDCHVYNNIFRACGTAILLGHSTGFTADSNCFFANTTINYTGTSAVLTDPKHHNYVIDGSGDYHLSTGSSCIGAADSATSKALDFDGVTRPQGGSYDIGPYEFVSADTTPPTLTSPTGTATSDTTADCTVSTNEGNGTLYCWVTTNSTETAANIVANGDTLTVSSTGVKTFNMIGLSASTTYYAHFAHRDAATNLSSASNSTSFTTDSPSVGGVNFYVVGGVVRRFLHRD